MVSVTQVHSANPCDDAPDLPAWLASVVSLYNEEELAAIRRAAEFAAPAYEGAEAPTGRSLLQHALGAAAILAGMRMDYESVCAALLHGVPGLEPGGQEKLVELFGHTIAGLVEGFARMEQIQELSEAHTQAAAGSGEKKKDLHAQTEGLRKMLLAMVEDIRVVLVKLAERTQTMRCLNLLEPARQRLLARETLDIFSPLANRLGVWQLKWELEDLSLRYLEPDLYKKIAKLLDERRVDRERYINNVVTLLRDELAQAEVRGEVKGRPKHIYSIINKMKRKNLDFDQLYDVRAVRILVEEVRDCYTVLGIVHNLWQPIPGEFDDYISHPKSNDYRSLHTAVIGPEGKALEVQIRTFDMHQHAELGVAAHWRYKEGGKSDARFDEKIAWIRRILAWKEDVADTGELVDQFKSELFEDQVFVLTPQGKVVVLPAGSTPLDFAYHVHTDLGHRCRGARVDGNMAPLNYPLQNGQRVEILTAKQGAPSRDWLNPAQGYLQSARARAKVRHWFKYEHFDENVSQGRAQLDRELHRLGMVDYPLEKLAQKFHYQKLDEFQAAIGRGDVTSHQLAAALQGEAPKPQEEEQPLMARPATAETSKGILVAGVGDLLTNMAKCCKPVPPDPIVGYVTRGRGVTVHRQDCPNMQGLEGERKDRLIAAQWGTGGGTVFPVDIQVEAYDRQGLLRDISEVLVREKVNLTGASTINKQNLAKMKFTLEITGQEQLGRLLALIRQVPSVIQAKRKG